MIKDLFQTLGVVILILVLWVVIPVLIATIVTIIIGTLVYLVISENNAEKSNDEPP